MIDLDTKDADTPRSILDVERFEPFDSFTVAEGCGYTTDEHFRNDVFGNPKDPPVTDFMPDIMYQKVDNFVLPDEYTAANAYRDLVLSTRCVVQGYPLSGTGETEADSLWVGNFWYRASHLLARARGSVLTPGDFWEYVTLFGKNFTVDATPNFVVKIINYLKSNFADLALTQQGNENTLLEFAHEVFQVRVTELTEHPADAPPTVEDNRKAAAEYLYYFARKGELYDPEVMFWLNVALTGAFPQTDVDTCQNHNLRSKQ